MAGRAAEIVELCFFQAQGLKRVLTTYEKVLNQPDDQFLYLMWQHHPSKSSCSLLIGILKVGRKHLYLLDENQRKFEEEPLCILDFYIHDSVQRRGNGHQLFDHMLRQESTSAPAVAIDRPSDAFLQFLSKFYGLTKPVWQSTNFVVFPEFFEGKTPVERYEKTVGGSRSEKFGTRRNDVSRFPTLAASRSAVNQRRSACSSESRFQHSLPETATKDTVAGLLHGDVAPELRRIAAPDTPLDRKNRRDFGHQSIW
ncbi:hypothetical protein OESDEN_05640 [Oesophagostomum dentatum]|uniref:N-acetyltransferase domain-containing protein n=1 Tax=Oesophagostomum dentatum TaxID=61180 RepID=A0A0B1TF24_OESDE|nr:hypothetical protein OESDEN_05640 [Oesophagostomum dentatum]